MPPASPSHASSLEDVVAELAELTKRQTILLKSLVDRRARLRGVGDRGARVVNPEELAAVDRSWADLR